MSADGPKVDAEKIGKDASDVMRVMLTRCPELATLFDKMHHLGFLARATPRGDGWGSFGVAFSRLIRPFDVEVSYDGRDDYIGISMRHGLFVDLGCIHDVALWRAWVEGKTANFPDNASAARWAGSQIEAILEKASAENADEVAAHLHLLAARRSRNKQAHSLDW